MDEAGVHLRLNVYHTSPPMLPPQHGAQPFGHTLQSDFLCQWSDVRQVPVAGQSVPNSFANPHWALGRINSEKADTS